MRFSLRTLLLLIMAIAAFLGLYRWIWPHYPSGHITVLSGPVAGYHPPGRFQSPPWSVVRFDDRIVCVSSRPNRQRTTFHSPFPILEYDALEPFKDWRPLDFGIVGRCADGSVGLLTIAPQDLRTPHVVTPYGPALQIMNAGRRTGSSPGIVIVTCEERLPWTDCLTVTSDGGGGVVVRVAVRVPTKVESTVSIRSIHSSDPIFLKRETGPIESDWEAHFEELPDGLWYITGHIDDLPKRTVYISPKPICFKKETTPQGPKVIQYR